MPKLRIRRGSMSAFFSLHVLVPATLFVVLALPTHAQSVPNGFRDEFLTQFGTSMSKFIALARAMPEETYSWSPGEGVMPVAQVYAHIARYNYYYPANYMGTAVPSHVDVESLETIKKKTEIIALLDQSGEHVRQLAEGISAQQLAQPVELYGRMAPQWAVLFQLVAHMNEHLGQSIAYARMNGVVPPWSQ